MPDEAKPQLDETLDAKPYEPPKGRGRWLIITAVTLAVAGGLLLLLAVKVRSYAWSVGAPAPWWGFRLGALAVLCGLVAGSLCLVAGIRAGNAKRPIQAIVALTVLVASVLVCVKAVRISTLGFVEHRKSACKNNLRQIGITCHIYAEEHGGVFPAQIEDLYPTIMDNVAVLRCPRPPGFWEAALPHGWVTPAPRGYTYVSGLRQADSGTCVLAFDRHEGDGANVVCLDSSVQWIKAPAPGQPDRLKAMLDQACEAVRKRGGEIRLVGE